jgi:anthranilate phosphoribosyltransferase
VHGADGLDEISISGDTRIGELADGEIREYTVNPKQFGMKTHDRRAIEVHTVDESKRMVEAVLEGQPGPAQDIVALNAGAALYVANCATSIAAGVDKARAALASGAARSKLEAFVKFSRELKA